MPLRDHFHPPLLNRKSWEGFHSGWAFVIAQRLNGTILGPGYESESQIHVGPQIEIEVATHEANGGPSLFHRNGTDGGVATELKTYAPPKPPITGVVAFADADLFEVRVYRTDGVWKLVAAVELVSPANTDRPSARRAFATKVASYLQKGVSVVVDLVTSRTAHLHDDLVELLHLPDQFEWQPETALSALAYRPERKKRRYRRGAAGPVAVSTGTR